MAVHYFLVYPILPLLTLVAVEALQYGRKGFDTTLVPEIRGTPDQILWKQASRRVVEFDGSEESVHGTFRDRVVLDWHTASLTIKDLRGTDSGPYELEATINNRKYYSQHEVAVIDKVAVPTISCVINGTVSGVGESDPPRTLATLRCSAEGPPSLNVYHWTAPGGVERGGAELAVTLAGDQDETVYTCRAANPVSQEMGTFVAKDCYPDSFSPSGLIIAMVVLCLLLVLTAGCFFGYRRWKKAHPKSNGIEDVEEQPLHRSNGSDNTKAYDKDNGATLPSTQRLALLSHGDPAMDSTSGQEEDQTTYSGGCGDSTRVSVHSSESRLPEPQQPTDLESKLNAGDSVSFLEEPSLVSESHLPPTASPVEREEEEEEEEEEERKGTGVACVSTGDEPSGERLVAADDPPVNVEALPSEMKEEVNVAEAPHGDRALQEKGEVKEDEGEDGQVAPQPETHSGTDAAAGDRGTGRRVEDEEETSHTPEDKRDDAEDRTGHVTSSTEPKLEAMERSEDQEDNHVTETSRDDQRVPEEGEVKEDDGKDRGVVSLSASRPEAHQDSEAVAGEGNTETSAEEETLHTPEDKRDDAEDEKGQVALPAEPAAETPERKVEDVPQTLHGDADVREEGEVEEDDGKDRGVASLPASRPETPQDSEAVAGEGNTETSTAEETLEVETPERKEGVDDVPPTHDAADVREEGEVEEEGGREGAMTGPTEMDSRPETEPDPDREPGESGAGRNETQGTGGDHDERKEERGDGPLPANHHVEAGERRDGNKEAKNEPSTE